MIDINAPIYVLIFFLALLLTVLAERALIPMLRRVAEQPIYEEGPSWHISKCGTPTMGGLAFVGAVFLCSAIAVIYLSYKNMNKEALSLIGCVLFASLNALVGVIDDCKKLKRKQNGGLTPKEKLFLQALIAAAFLFYRFAVEGYNGVIYFSFGEIDIGLWYYPLTFLILLWITNCANLTDGIDGLASGVAFAISAALFLICCALSTDATIIGAALMGATVGFLVFNLHPAKVFMGDTGSLFLGAMLASAGVIIGNPLIILLLGGVYTLEGLSVIIQVISYKLTKKRIFRMAPLHHHLEKTGWSENRICIAAIILTLLLAIPVYLVYLP